MSPDAREPSPAALAGARAVASFWLDDPRAPAAAAAPLADARAPTWSWSAAATPGCGRRCWPRSATPAATSSLLEGGTVRLGGAGATAASARPASPTASATGCARWPDELRELDGWAAENLDAIGRRSPTLRHRLRLRARPGELDRGHRSRPGRGAAARRPTMAARTAHELELLDADAGARAGRLADLPRRRCCDRRRRDGRAGPAGLGPARGVPARSACGSTSSTRVTALARRGRGRAGAPRPTARSVRAARVALATNAFPLAAAPAAA